jgi:hypothetical protein
MREENTHENGSGPYYAGRKNRGAFYGREGNFNRDVEIAKKTENRMACLMCDLLSDRKELRKAWFVGSNNDYRYDFMISLYNGNLSREKFNVTFEVKEDQKCAETGNVGVEFRCCGRPSGISVSQADFYIYHVHTGESQDTTLTLLIRTENLKKAIREKKYFRIATSFRDGRDRPADNYLFRLGDMKKIAFAVIGSKMSPDTRGEVRRVFDEKMSPDIMEAVHCRT